jgi:hypothetical protein
LQQKEEGQSQESESPFSSMLTQDEEPVTPEPVMLEDQEPEVITRQGV